MSQTVYINKIMKKYGITRMEDTQMIKDYAITKSENDELFEEFNIESKIGYINDLVRSDEGRVTKIEGDKNHADIFTKSQDRKRHINNVIGLNLPEENDKKRIKLSK